MTGVGLDPAQECVKLHECALERELQADRLVRAEVLGRSGLQIEQLQRRRPQMVDDLSHQLVEIGPDRHKPLIRGQVLLEPINLSRRRNSLEVAADPRRGHLSLFA